MEFDPILSAPEWQGLALLTLSRRLVCGLKKLPVDVGQHEMRHTTFGKRMAFDMVPHKLGGKALDLGCRDGYWSERLRSKGYEVVSCDIEPLCPGATRVDANQKLPFSNAQFDLVWCTEVIEHLLDTKSSLAEMRRVLKPNGTLLLTTPNSSFWVFRLTNILGIPLSAIQNQDHHLFLSFADFAVLLPGCDTMGYFPYMLYKRSIRRYASLLSPTIVVRFRDAASGEFKLQ